ncbi:EthD domain-containing protein [Arthrobacter sp. NPDC093128]|uniref:EthD domain-containing protein n=1 Tax=Arthrobacter sp. NPDC093128 TaxID=3154979 RepID=UPI0034411C87
MAFTVVFLTRRKPGLTLEQFREHYLTTHFELASRVPGLVSYRQQPVRHDGAPLMEEIGPVYDAVSEYSFASDADARAAFTSPEWIALNEDTGGFIDWPTVVTLPVEDAHVYGGAVR